MDCNSPSVKTNKARIFISYSHRGNGPKWKAALINALQVFERHHLLDVWEDGKIRVSSFWDDDIRQAMSNARLAVVLLTKESLESEYILNTEFPFLRERQQRDKLPVFPVICEPCDWKAYDWLRATQAPNESNPLSHLSEPAQARIFRRLATDIAGELSYAALAELPKPDQPLPPDHVYLDKFPLTRGGGKPEKLIGREQELALLDLAFAQPRTAIVSLVAWGGVGKTMLVQHWLQRLQREGWFGARRVYAWSFYSQGTKEDRQGSEDTFLAHALAWFGVQCEPTLSPWDKGKILADAIARERTLLILDGIEPLQYPPGPMGGQLREPGVQSLLKQLARKVSSVKPETPNSKPETGSGLCLVTTREPLTDLTDFERRPDSAWGSMLRVDLGNLTEEAGAALLRHAGAKRSGAAEIKADDAELLAASREVDGHALTLNLLGRLLARAHGGDIRRRDLVRFEEADRKEQGGTTFKMLAAFENWFAKSGEFGARQLAILRILGLFDRPADSDCIGALRKPPVIVGLTYPLFTTRLDASTGQTTVQPLLEEDWNTATSFLADFGLLLIQADANNTECLLDCHPLIREHFAMQLREQFPEAWQNGHHRLFVHLSATVMEYPETNTEMEPLLQAVGHGCKAGQHQYVLDNVYWQRIQRGEMAFNIDILGAMGADLMALTGFFEKLWSVPVSMLTEKDRTFVIGQAAFRLTALGRLQEALVPNHILVVQRVKYAEKEPNEKAWNNAAYSVGNLTSLYHLLGDLRNAKRCADQSITLADKGANSWHRQMSLAIRGEVLHHMGYTADALKDFVRAEAISKNTFPFLLSVQGLRYCDFLFDQGKIEEVVRRAELIVNFGIRSKWVVDVGLGHLLLGRTKAKQAQDGDVIAITASIDHINKAMNNLRCAGFQDNVARCLLARTELCRLIGDYYGALNDLDEAWDIAERGPMRLHMVDIHLYRARLFFREKPYPWKSPQDDLAAAEKLINECGYHRRDEELADAKRAILGG